MLRPWSLLPALVAAAATLAGAGAAVAMPVPELGAGRPALPGMPVQGLADPAEEEDPLAVRIRALSPSYIPERGPIRIRGSVTNTSDERWRAINVHVFLGATPIRTTAELDVEALREPTELVGDRITVPGSFDAVGGLDPGEKAKFTIRLENSAVTATEPGVYWFGVHALGNTTEARDGIADGRARTFLPLVGETGRPVNTALVVPIRHPVQYAEDGRLDDPESWAKSLRPGGALRSLVDLGTAAGSRPLTWLIDPAVPDAVRALANGNQPRSLAPTVEEPPGDDETESPGQTGEADSEEAEPDPGDAGTLAEPLVGEAGADWLGRLRESLKGSEILALPYGDLDVSAAAERDSQAYTRAVRRSGKVLQPWGLNTNPAVMSPSGYLDPEAIAGLDSDATILATDRMFDVPPPVARTDGHRILVVSTAAADERPGPDDPISPVSMRQRIVSDAALRAMNPGRKPLVVVLPQDWSPTSIRGFFRGLNTDWLELTTVSGVSNRPGKEIDRNDLIYPQSQTRRELDAVNFASASALTTAGDLLQNVLSGNTTVASRVADEALSSLSYSARDEPNRARAAADRSTRWIQARLGAVRVEAPRSVTLSSMNGPFAATVTNDLDFPVTVSLRADADDEQLTIADPGAIEVAANGRYTVLLDASTDTLGIHDVELIVTDLTGTPLGASDDLPIRSTQVSSVIWVILGAGLLLLFAAIAVRLFRRIRRATAA